MSPEERVVLLLMALSGASLREVADFAYERGRAEGYASGRAVGHQEGHACAEKVARQARDLFGA